MEECDLVFLGGDRRMEVAASYLSKKGYRVMSLSLSREKKEDEAEEVTERLIPQASALILPTPCTIDDRSIYTPRGKKDLLWSDLCGRIRQGQIVIGGKIPMSWKESAEKKGATVFDVAASERLARKNALPTAEGALAIALETMPCTVCASTLLLLGYGRISRMLAPMVLSLGGEVIVCARSEQARKEAEDIGCHTVSFDSMHEVLDRVDWVCNTVPSIVFGEKEMMLLSPDALLLDLSSRPGGIDRMAGERTGRRVVWALGLPGKVAPKSAGIYLAQEIEEILVREVRR